MRTIDDLAKSLKKPASELVKSLFFEGSKKEPDELTKPICVLLRGSDEMNPIKLKNFLGTANPPRMLTDEEVKKVTGAMPGSCGPVGLDIPIFMDSAVEGMKNYSVGANEDDFHLKNVNHDRDYKPNKVLDLRVAREGDKNPEGEGTLKEYRGIEVGHIFYLGNKYSKAMGATYLNQNGKALPIEMGCYGIGISRVVQAVIEQNHDKDGIVWPKALAPYEVHICLLDPKDEEIAKLANSLYEELKVEGVDCLLDDRDERPGFKFKDADSTWNATAT